MKLKHLITTGSLVLLPFAASAASLIIPAAGTGPGANGSSWQTEVTLHNVSSSSIATTLLFHGRDGADGSTTVTLGPRATTSIQDIVHSRFGKDSATGAIEIQVADENLSSIAVTSRTANFSEQGQFGQDIPAVNLADAAKAGDLQVVAGPSSTTDFRFNLGVYAGEATTIHWELVRADGTTAAQKDLTYAAGTQQQYNNGIEALFGLDAKNDDAVHATVVSGSALVYGSAINQVTGDPAYVPGIAVREDVHISFLGVDVDENGTVDVADANHDGVLDQPIDVFTSLYPNFFRVVASGDNGQAVTYELVNAPRDAQLIDTAGTIEFAPGGDVKGQSGELRVRITSNGHSTVVTIPVNFR
jgi:hypothetical protein